MSQDDGETRPFRFVCLCRDPRVQEPLLPGPEALAVETQAARALARRLQRPTVRASRAVKTHESPCACTSGNAPSRCSDGARANVADGDGRLRARGRRRIKTPPRLGSSVRSSSRRTAYGLPESGSRNATTSPSFKPDAGSEPNFTSRAAFVERPASLMVTPPGTELGRLPQAIARPPGSKPRNRQTVAASRRGHGVVFPAWGPSATARATPSRSASARNRRDARVCRATRTSAPPRARDLTVADLPTEGESTTTGNSSRTGALRRRIRSSQNS